MPPHPHPPRMPSPYDSTLCHHMAPSYGSIARSTQPRRDRHRRVGEDGIDATSPWRCDDATAGSARIRSRAKRRRSRGGGVAAALRRRCGGVAAALRRRCGGFEARRRCGGVPRRCSDGGVAAALRRRDGRTCRTRPRELGAPRQSATP